MLLLDHLVIPSGSLLCPTCKETHLERRDARGSLLATRNAEFSNGSLSVRIPETIELPVCPVYGHAYPDAGDVASAEALLERIWKVRLKKRWGVRTFCDDEFSLGAAWSPCHGEKSFHLYLLGLGVEIAPVPGDEPRVRIVSFPTPRSVWERLRGIAPKRKRPLEAGWFAGVFPWEMIPTGDGVRFLKSVPEYFGLGVSFYLGMWTPRPFCATLFLGPWKLRVGRRVWANREGPRLRKRRHEQGGEELTNDTAG